MREALAVRRPTRVAALVIALTCALTILVPTGTPPARAVETHPVENGSVELEGRGYGHGRGLSQWGALGAARSGLTWPAILAHYYPGTTLTGQPDSDIVVRLSSGRTGEVVVDAAPGMRLNWRDGVLALPERNGTARILSWRLRPGSGALVLDFVDTSAAVWKQYSTVPGTAASFAAPSGLLRLVAPDYARREYRGALGGMLSGGALTTINTVRMEAYLRSVVPAEMPSSWDAAALSAQAVAARTYASHQRHHATGATDTCDTTSCQVYRGRARLAIDGTLLTTYEAASTDAAITGTSGRVVITGGAFSYAFTQFSASNGGWSVAGSVPYLRAGYDPYDGVVASTAHRWTTRVSASTIRAAYPAVGTPQGVTVVARDGNGEWGGRVLSARVEGTSGTVTVTGDALRSALGLRSTWWTSAGAAQPSGGIASDVDGDGHDDLWAASRPGTLVLYRGTASGSYSPPTTGGTGWRSVDSVVSPGDVTGDGIPDLYARERATGVLWLYPMRRDGATTTRVAVGTGWDTVDLLIASGDVTGDGVPDLYARGSERGELRLYVGRPGGGFSTVRVVNDGWHRLDAVVRLRDVTGDGRPELVGRERSTGALLLYPTASGGSVQAPREINTGWGSFDTLVGVDGSGGAAILAREPRTSGGRLWRYPVLSGGVVAPGRLVGTGWDLHVALG
jgi:SpoIID/LytB domain protein